jgi:hypothetical protein
VERREKEERLKCAWSRDGRGRTVGRCLHSTPGTLPLKQLEYNYISRDLNYLERPLRREILDMDVYEDEVAISN